jgi:hypothetical protein
MLIVIERASSSNVDIPNYWPSKCRQNDWKLSTSPDPAWLPGVWIRNVDIFVFTIWITTLWRSVHNLNVNILTAGNLDVAKASASVEYRFFFLCKISNLHKPLLRGIGVSSLPTTKGIGAMYGSWYQIPSGYRVEVNLNFKKNSKTQENILPQFQNFKSFHSFLYFSL